MKHPWRGKENNVVPSSIAPSEPISTRVREFGNDLLTALQSAMQFRKLLISTNGYIGLGPIRILPKDLICVLFGCSVPVVVRPKGKLHVLIGVSMYKMSSSYLLLTNLLNWIGVLRAWLDGWRSHEKYLAARGKSYDHPPAVDTPPSRTELISISQALLPSRSTFYHGIVYFGGWMFPAKLACQILPR